MISDLRPRQHLKHGQTADRRCRRKGEKHAVIKGRLTIKMYAADPSHPFLEAQRLAVVREHPSLGMSLYRYRTLLLTGGKLWLLDCKLLVDVAPPTLRAALYRISCGGPTKDDPGLYHSLTQKVSSFSPSRDQNMSRTLVYPDRDVNGPDIKSPGHNQISNLDVLGEFGAHSPAPRGRFCKANPVMSLVSLPGIGQSASTPRSSFHQLDVTSKTRHGAKRDLCILTSPALRCQVVSLFPQSCLPSVPYSTGNFETCEEILPLEASV